MKRICHVTSAHRRYDTRIFQKECKSLVENGYEVYFLVNDEEQNEEKEHIKIISTGFLPKNRFERFFMLKNKILKKALMINAEIYHFHDPDLIGLALRIKKKIPGVKIIFDSHEDVPAQILTKKWIPFVFRKIASVFFGMYQKRTLRKFDYLIGVTPHLVKKLKKINVNTGMVTNYPLLNRDDITNRRSDDISANVICFAGGIEEQWNHETILNALAGIEVEYILCGNGDENYIERLKENSQWNKVNYLGKVSFQEVREIYRKSSVGLAMVSYSPNTNYKRGTLGNTKLFEYMQAGLPVICTDFALWKEIVENNQCGICVNPNDSKAIGKAIEYLLSNPMQGREMGENGRKLVLEKFNWSIEEKKLLKLYSEL